MKVSDEMLRGRPVFASDGSAVGEIAALFIDSEALRVDSVQVRLRKEVADRLGAERTAFRAGMVEIPIHMVQSGGDAVLLSVGLDDLRQVLPGAAPEEARAPQP